MIKTILKIFVKILVFFAVLGLMLFTVAYFWGEDATASGRSRDEKTAVWLARSCIGEAGFNSVETGECQAIMWVYRKGAHALDRTTLIQARLYSSAIKRGKHHKRPWIFHLDRSGKKPRGWKGASWKNHRDRWLETLALADLFMQWRVEDPLPSAQHYGSKTDTKKLKRKFWRRIKVGRKYRNLFYEPRPRKEYRRQAR